MKTRIFAILFLLFTLVGLCEEIAIAWGPVTHMTILDDVLQDPRLNPDVRKILQDNLKYAKGGVVGPDMFYFSINDKRYSDIAHYCSPGDFSRKMLEMAKKDGDPKKIAFAYGWMIHVVTDSIGHPWVNSLAGGEYDPDNSTIKKQHSHIEQSIDKKNFLEHAKELTDPITGEKFAYFYDMDIDSPDAFISKVFSDLFGCSENAPPAYMGEDAENLSQFFFNFYPTWIMRKDENEFNTTEYQDAYEKSISQAIKALNSAGGTLENWDLDSGEAPYIKDENNQIISNPNYRGYVKCKEQGQLKDCGPVTRTGPGGDHPDDTVSVGGGINSLEASSLDSIYRLAPKKDLKSVLWFKDIQNANTEYNNLPPNASAELRKEKLDKILLLTGQLNDPANWREFSANNPKIFNEIESVPDVAVLRNGHFEEMATLINRNHEPVRIVPLNFSPKIFTNQPVLIIPSGGLFGLENSEFMKASLDEYVKQGGTLIVFSQQHGYEFSILPVPKEDDGSYKIIGGYGWSEDQSCFIKAAFIETWHQMLAGQSKSTPTLHLDGYFTNYPSNATVLLRRTSNGQPALLMYEYGLGRVIITSMYSDFALKENQASAEEIALIRDMISWAKRPDVLPEIKPGETVSVSLEVKNISTNDALSVKVLIYNPDRKTLLSEQMVSVPIPAGQSTATQITYTTTLTSTLGIYHIDYILLDAQGNIIQPQAETDSGRFLVINPPSHPYRSPDFGFSVLSDAEYYIYGSPATFTFILWNHTETERRITVKGNLSHHRIWIVKTVTVPPKGSASFNYILEEVKDLDRCFTWFYDESGKEVGLQSKGIWVVYPAAKVTVATDKDFYGKNQTVQITTSVTNSTNFSWQPSVKIIIKDTRNYKIFEDVRTIDLRPLETHPLTTSFLLPTNSYIGSYCVEVVVFYGQRNITFAIGTYARFEVLESQISTTLTMPQLINSGSNSIPITFSNMGRIGVSNGAMDISLRDPDGGIISYENLTFSLAAGESKNVDVPISIPSLKFGDYTLTYTQSDETKTGKPTNIVIPNTVSIALSLDKPSYKVRETASLTVDLMNTGKFNLDKLSVTVSAQDANYTDSKIIRLEANPNILSLNFSIPIPENIPSGQNNVDVKIALSSGAEIRKSIFLVVPDPTLVIEHQGATILRAGDLINITVENTGGVDTTFTTENVSVKDHKGVEIYSGSTSGSILSGRKSNFWLSRYLLKF